ncbi:hypothetical protein RF55_24080, partial [Lasius niger]
IAGAGRAFAAAEVHRQRHAPVPGMFDRFHLAQAHLHMEAGIDAGGDFGLTGARGTGTVQQLFGETGQTVEFLGAGIGRGDGLVHGRRIP